MLAPFLVNLLMLCFSLLFTGWAIDVIGGWLHSPQAGASQSNRSVIGSVGRAKSGSMPACVK